MAQRERSYIFWDNSNIFIPAQEVATRKEGLAAKREVRVNFFNIFDLARAGRDLVKSVCVGSVPPELGQVWGRLRGTGITVELYERGAESGKEQGIDQCLQVHMLRAVADEVQPATAVLMTGDGAGYDTGAGFHADLERMAKRGWGIEVISWDIACNKRLREWAKTAGVYIPLEDYYDAVTYREGVRRSKALSLTRRPRAQLGGTAKAAPATTAAGTADSSLATDAPIAS